MSKQIFIHLYSENIHRQHFCEQLASWGFTASQLVCHSPLSPPIISISLSLSLKRSDKGKTRKRNHTLVISDALAHISRRLQISLTVIISVSKMSALTWKHSLRDLLNNFCLLKDLLPHSCNQVESLLAGI